MKASSWYVTKLVIGVLFLTFSSTLFAQNISVPGITGVDFDTTGGSYSIAFSTDFNVHGVDVTSSGLTLNYNADNETLSLYGTASASFDGESMAVGFGDSGSPGLVITDGALTSVSLSITTAFTLRSLSITPDNLGFSWTSGSTSFSIYGDLTATVGSDDIDASLGDINDPGIVIDNGDITSINMSISAEFSINGLTITPTDLTFEYDEANSQYEIYGDITAGFDGNTVAGSLGDADTPGFVIQSGALTSLNIGVTADFTLESLTVSPDALTFQWDAASSHFEIFGSASISFNSNTADIGLGDDSTPGLVIDSGSITSLNMSLTTDFTIDGLTISPDNLTLEYSSADDEYQASGNIDVTLDGNTITGTLGDSENPGFIIDGGNLTSFNIDLSGNIDLKGISLTSDGITFEYDAANVHFEMYGSATTTIDGNSIDLALGNADDPGVIVDGGSLTHINFGITADFDMKGITISPTDLTLEYDSGNDFYEFYGDLKVKFDGEEVDASFGDADDPGMVYDNGNITHINFGVTADFSVKGITVSPDSFTFEYDSGNDYFEMYGSVAVKFDGEEVDAGMGDSGDPGLVYDSGSITHVNFGLTADFEIKSLAVIPTNLTFEYDSGNDHFEMYGDLTFKIGSDEVTANMGDTDDPGLTYKNNSIQHVNIGVTADFSLEGLKIKTTDLGAEWNSGSDYHIYGDADLSIDSENIDVDFGTFSDPGIVVRNGNLHSFEVDVNSDLKLGNLEVETKDLDIKYSSSKYEVTGEMSITEVFSLSVTLGEGSQGGLEIDVSGAEPRFKVEALEIDIEHANLGAIDLKKLDLKFNSSGIEESDVSVVFPQGWEIDAVMKFTGNPAKLNSIEIDYRANNLADAIEMFEGVQIAFLGASVDNLTKPSELTVTGTIETIYGGGFSLDGKSATLLQMRDEVTIKPNFFEIQGDVNVGAYRSGTDSWHSLIGSGDISLSIGTITYYIPWGESFCNILPPGSCLTTEWSGVKATASIKIPGDPLIEADATVTLDTHRNFDALVDVEFIVPHWVPFIGGKHYGSVDGAVRYKHGDLHHSYGAGWVRIKTFWHTYHVGAEYNFGSRKVSKIGSGTISSIQRDINNDQSKAVANSDAPQMVVHTFDVTDPMPNSMLIEVDWAEASDSAFISVIGPEGNYELTKAVVVSQNDSTTTPTLTYEENMDIVVGDTSSIFLYTTASALNEDSTLTKAKLLDGRYQLVISYFDEATAIDSVTFTPLWQAPEVSISAEKTVDNRFNLEIDYWSTLPDSTILSFYVGSSPQTTDAKLIDHVYASNFDDLGYGTETYELIPDFITGADTLYFYGIIEDGENPPIKTEVTQGFPYQPDIIGQLVFPAGVDSLKEGQRVFIDEDVDGSFDVESTGGLELFSITDSTGFFAISGLTSGEEYELRIVLPPGYRIVGEADRFGSEIIQFDGTPQTLLITMEAYTEEETD